MNVKEFRAKIRAGQKITIDGKKLNVEGIIKFRLDDGSYYIKCSLSGNYIFAEDSEENVYNLLKELNTSFKQPFPKNSNLKAKNSIFYTLHTQ